MTDVLRIVGDGKDIPDRPVPDGLADKDLIEIFRWIVLLRAFDERAVSLQRQGRIGTYALYWGEEATQAAPLYACRESDWVFPSYRQNAVGILRGISPATVLAWWRGYGGSHGFWNPREHQVAPICVPIATHLPHAVGLSWAAKIQGEDTAALAWFGDGATSEGDFHEAMNFAAVLKTATIFFCVNNQWAISTPLTKQMATQTIAEKARAYGMPGIRVDGFDPLACWKVTREALDRGMNGGGPSLIEAYCYRIGPHGTADDPRLYRDESEAEKWRPLEPVGRLAGYLRRNGVLERSQEENIYDEARLAIAEAVKEMEALPQLGVEVLFDDVYASGRPRSFQEGLEELAGIERAAEARPMAAPPSSGAGEEGKTQ